MKTVFKSLPVLIICSLFIFAACAGDNYENAMLNISVNNDRVRAAALAIAVEEIDHQIVLTGPTGTVLTYNITGAGNVSASVTAGTWRIDITGYYGAELYSQGTASVAVKAGQSNSVSVLMNVVWQEGGFIPPGTEFPQLPGTALIEGDHWFNTTGTPYFGTITASYIHPTAIPYYDGPEDGYIVQWYLGGQLVQTDTDVVFLNPPPPLAGPSSKFELKEEYWNRDLFVIISHPDYYGVKSNSFRICRAISFSTDWGFFIAGTNPDWIWEGNSFILNNDFSSPFIPIGDGAPPEPFNGYLDGNGKMISLSIASSNEHAGLFAHIGPRGTVMNFKIDGIVVNPASTINHYAGGVAGLNEGTIMNISYDYASGSIYINTTAPNNNYAGGIAGYNKGIIKNCYVNIDDWIRADNALFSFAGGIAGVNEGEISYCWVISSISNPMRAYHGAGGIAGKNDKTINNCMVLQGSIQQPVGTGKVGRIWGTGNGTGRANYANNDDNILFMQYGPLATDVFVDSADDRTDTKHGKGVPYTPVPGNTSPSDAGSENWWMYTAGWDAVWDKRLPPPLTRPPEIEKPWHWTTMTSDYFPVLWWQL